MQLNNWLTDAYLLMFCRARQFQIKKVIQMFMKFIEFRKEFRVDTIIDWYDTSLDEKI